MSSSCRRLARKTCALATVAFITAASAHAEDAADEPDSQAIVVTGARAGTTGLTMSIADTPQSLSIIDGARLEEQGLTNIAEVLDQVVGIQSNSTSALGTDGTSYIARGFAVQNYQIDGVARPTNLYGFAEETADMIAYDRIEVVRGSNGLMTGIGQPSASINLIRKRPTDTFRANAAATAGSWNLYRLEADIGGPVTSDGAIRARVAGAWQENDTFIDREHANRQALYGIVAASLSSSTELSAGVEYQNFTNKGASRGGVPLYYTDGTETDFDRSTNTGANWSEFRRKSVSLFASLSHNFDPNWRLQVDVEHKTGSYDETIGYFWGSSIDRTTGEGGSLLSARWASDLKLDAVYANLQGRFEAFGQTQELAVTASHARYKDEGPGFPGWWSGPDYWTPIDAFDLFATGDATKPNLDPTGETYGDKVETSAVTGVLRLKPFGGLSLIGGSRVTWWKQSSLYDDGSGTGGWTPGIDESAVLTPYAGAVFDITRTLSAYASYASVFEPHTELTVDGDVLPPLEGNTYELGLKATLADGHLIATAAVFKMKQNNYAEADGAGIYAPDGSVAYHAISGLVSKGFELEVSGQPLPGWRIAGGFANATSKDIDGVRLLTEIPRNTFKLFTTYALQGGLEGLTVGGNLRWQSKGVAGDPGPNGEIYEQGSLALVDLLASYRVTDNFSLAVHADNIFDKTYYSALYTGSSRYGTPRRFTVTLRGKL